MNKTFAVLHILYLWEKSLFQGRSETFLTGGGGGGGTEAGADSLSEHFEMNTEMRRQGNVNFIDIPSKVNVL